MKNTPPKPIHIKERITPLVQSPLVLFVHGWGLGPGLWRPLLREMKDLSCETLDLGFFDPSKQSIPRGQPVVMVGHSLGFLWLLMHHQAPWFSQCRGLLSISGFSRFSHTHDFPHGVHHRILERMIRRLPKDPQGVLNDFRQKSGLLHQGVHQDAHQDEQPTSPPPTHATISIKNLNPLIEGLRGLQTWDGRQYLANWPGLLHGLASKDDAIVSQEMTRDSFSIHSNPTITWLDHGGHLLPLTRPKACADQIRHLLQVLAE